MRHFLFSSGNCLVLLNMRIIYDYTMCVWNKILNACFMSVLVCRRFGSAKKSIKLFVRSRKQGSYIASVPLQKLDKFSKTPEKYGRWSFEDGRFLRF